MVNINKNTTLEVLQQLVENNISKTLNYMPDSFNEQQKEAIELFKKRIFLEKTIEEAIYFNRKLAFPNENKNLQLATTAEELVEIFKLRSSVYADINYQDEFPDTIEGLNFDKYDSTSAILSYKTNNTITGTTRLIFDSINKLPSEDKFSFDKQRKRYKTIGELSRLVVHKNTKGLNLEFKNIMAGIYTLFMSNNIDITFLAIIKEHYKLYTKFGGSEIIFNSDDYGNLGHPVYILSWDPSKVSRFFKKAFLK
jgi:hypothetical protein